MADCGNLAGLTLGCRTVAGIKNILIGVYPSGTTAWYSDTNGTVDGLTGITAYQYQVNPETGSAVANPKGNRQNGTIYYEHQVLLAVNALTIEARNEVMLMGTNPKLIIFAQNVDETWWMYGEGLGMALTEGEGTTGVAAGDFKGYNLTFTSNEKLLPFEVESAVIAGIIG